RGPYMDRPAVRAKLIVNTVHDPGLLTHAPKVLVPHQAFSQQGVAVGGHERGRVGNGETGTQLFEADRLVLTETGDGGSVGVGGDEHRGSAFAVELVRVHHQLLLDGLGQVVRLGKGQPLVTDVLAGQSHSCVV